MVDKNLLIKFIQDNEDRVVTAVLLAFLAVIIYTVYQLILEDIQDRRNEQKRYKL